MHEIGFDNPWLKAVEAARRRIPAWAAALIGGVGTWALVLVGVKAAGMLTAAIGPSAFDGQGGAILRQALYVSAIFGPLLLFPWAIMRFWEARPAPVGGWSPLAGLALGTPVGAAGFAAVVGIAALAGVVGHGFAQHVGAAAALGVAASLVLTAIQAGGEEYVFRAWLQPLLCARWGAWVGLIATAVVFAAAHIAGGERGPITLANMLLGGLLFGLLALRTGGLWAPFAAHTAWNWMEGSALGLDPDPGVGPLGSLVDLDLHGPTLWSGGAEHLNASLAETLVLLALILAFAALGRRRR